MSESRHGVHTSLRNEFHDVDEDIDQRVHCEYNALQLRMHEYPLSNGESKKPLPINPPSQSRMSRTHPSSMQPTARMSARAVGRLCASCDALAGPQ
eukprot:2579669-Rhodomonas_salina.1